MVDTPEICSKIYSEWKLERDESQIILKPPALKRLLTWLKDECSGRGVDVVLFDFEKLRKLLIPTVSYQENKQIIQRELLRVAPTVPECMREIARTKEEKARLQEKCLRLEEELKKREKTINRSEPADKLEQPTSRGAWVGVVEGIRWNGEQRGHEYYMDLGEKKIWVHENNLLQVFMPSRSAATDLLIIAAVPKNQLTPKPSAEETPAQAKTTDSARPGIDLARVRRSLRKKQILTELSKCAPNEVTVPDLTRRLQSAGIPRRRNNLSNDCRELEEDGLIIRKRSGDTHLVKLSNSAHMYTDVWLLPGSGYSSQKNQDS